MAIGGTGILAPNFIFDKLVNPDTGYITEEWLVYFSQLQSQLQTNFSNEGLVAPSQNATNIAKIEPTAFNGTFIYNETTNQPGVIIDNVWEPIDVSGGTVTSISGGANIVLTPNPIISTGTIALASILTSVTWNGNAIGIGYGGTGQTTYSNGQLLIGNAGGTLSKSTLTPGAGVTITNGSGTITISATGSGGTVTNIGTGTGLTGGPITSTGTISIANNAANSLAGFDGSGIFGDVTVSTGLSLSGGVLTASGSGGTVTSVTGTANQINVATGTTTPVLSLSSTLITPGTFEASSTSKFDGAVTIANTMNLVRSGGTVSIFIDSGTSTFSQIDFFMGSVTTTPNIIADPISTSGRLQINSDILKIGSLGSGNGVVLSTAGVLSSGSVSLTTNVSGVLPPANGGTGINNGTNTLTLTGASYTLNQNVSTSGAPSFTGLTCTGQLKLSTAPSGYNSILLGGGNSDGFIWSNFGSIGDGIAIGYNYYVDSGGTAHIINSFGATTALIYEYGTFDFRIGAVNTAPSSVMSLTSSTLTLKGVNVAVATTNTVSIGTSSVLLQGVYSGAYFGGGYGGATPWQIASNGSDMFLEAGVASSQIYFRPSAGSTTGGIVVMSTVTRPENDNAITFGDAGHRMISLWAVNGTIQTSDSRQKKNIKESTLGLDFINKLQPKSWSWNNGNEQEKEHHGFTTEDIAAVCSDNFGGLYKAKNEDEIGGLNYSSFIAPLVKAIQELSKEVENLKNLSK